MNGLATAQIGKNVKSEIKQQLNLNWADNPSIQKLLDAVVSIIVEEYVQIAKQNPDVFIKQGETK